MRQANSLIVCLVMLALLTMRVQCFGIGRRAWSAVLSNRLSTMMFSAVVEPEGIEKGSTIDDTAVISSFRAPSSFDSQFWLDLRGTAILPDEAIDFLERILVDSNSEKDNGDHGELVGVRGLIDRIIVSEENLSKAAEHSVRGIDLVFAKGDSICRVSPSVEEPGRSTAGRILECEPKHPPDVLVALETAMAGGWLLLEPSGMDDEDATSWLEEQVKNLSGFMDPRAATTTSSSGLLLPGLRVDSSVSPEGGLAVRCPNKMALLRIASALAASEFTNMITSSTESGILLPTGISDLSGSGAPFSTALVLPFDALLWKEAVDLNNLV